jgi:hypothetical protein
MTPFDEDAQDADVPEQAVKALTAAHQQALQAGMTLVLVRDDQLIRIGPDGVTVLRQLPPRKKVAVREKSVRP